VGKPEGRKPLGGLGIGGGIILICYIKNKDEGRQQYLPGLGWWQVADCGEHHNGPSGSRGRRNFCIGYGTTSFSIQTAYSS
jgi:hypothetical protein